MANLPYQPKAINSVNQTHTLYDIIAAFYILNRKVGQIIVTSVVGNQDAEQVVEQYTTGKLHMDKAIKTIATMETALETLYCQQVVTVFMKEPVPMKRGKGIDNES